MKLLLIVGSSNDIFVYNLAKWIKVYKQVEIDVFEFFPSNEANYDNRYYEEVGHSKVVRIPIVRDLLNPYIGKHKLSSFLKGKNYDIIHCHWIVAPLVMTSHLKEHCKKLLMTFWGGEFERQRILGSKDLYLKYLEDFSKEVDCIINEEVAFPEFRKLLPEYTGLFRNGQLGSAPLDVLYQLMEKESKQESKKILHIPTDKLTVQIGYSAKIIHQHLPIIKELSRIDNIKDKIHIIAPMTRGVAPSYVEKVESALSISGYTYTLIKGRFLDDSEIARLRNATDVVLQLSTTDGFSRSIIEAFCAKSLVIYGTWLNYESGLDSHGFKGLSVDTLQTGVSLLTTIINNFKKYSDITYHNSCSGRKQFLWSECIKDWLDAYDELLK